ncbi:MAG: YggT family protein [Spirochaetota bacterium]|nr:MAG: YggT family protein [Spirochaetota bacterium]
MVYLANIIRLLFSIYILLIFVRVIFAWLRPNMFNPVVRFVYNSTNPYLKLFAGLKFLRIGALDLTPILALYLLYLIQELTYKVLLTGYFSLEILISMIIILLFKFIYFILFIFIIAVGLRFIFEILGVRSNNIFVNIVYSVSEPAVRPLRNWIKIKMKGGFDIHVLISLVILILLRYLILPRILQLISMLFG